MTELQITLAVLALLFVALLYWLGQRRKRQHQPVNTAQPAPAEVPVEKTVPTPPVDDRQPDLFAGTTDPLKEENGRLVLELDADEIRPAAGQPVDVSRTNFGRTETASKSQPAAQPEQADEEVVLPDSAVKAEPRIFAIMVLGTKPYPWKELQTALVGIGLELDPAERIFVRRNEHGKIYLRVANALEPGIFPLTDEEGAEFESPGVAMILQLPTCVHAPFAMNQMIKDARKLSQRLGAHLYNEKRQRLNESQLKAMRDASLDYVSEPLT